MSRITLGCGPLSTQKKPFGAPMECAEILEATQAPVRLNTLKRWRADAGASFEFVIGAWRWLTLEPLDERSPPPFDFPKSHFGLLKPSEANQKVWEAIMEQVTAAGARAVIVRTPPAFSPSEENLKNFKAFRQSVASEANVELIWEPRGIWAADEVPHIAAELGVTPSIDPHGHTHLPDPPQAPAYYSVVAPAGRVRFSEEDFAELAEFLLAHEHDARVVFRGPDRENNLRALARVLGR